MNVTDHLVRSRRAVEDMTWFGASWGSPLNEFCEQQGTPVGEPCLHCEEPIERWASGVVLTCIQQQAGTRRRRPQHLECFLRGILGSVGHLQRRCSCYGGQDEDPPNLSKRDAARAAVLAFLERAELIDKLDCLDD